jgi:hypothetical protein
MMGNDHHILRTMKRELRHDSKDSTKIAQVNTRLHKIYLDLQERSDEKPSSPKHYRGLTELSIDKTNVIGKSLAKRRAVNYNARKWRQKRGLDVKSMPNQVIDFIKALFSILDGQASGTVSGQVLLKAFVSLGVSGDPLALEQVNST